MSSVSNISRFPSLETPSRSQVWSCFIFYQVKSQVIKFVTQVRLQLNKKGSCYCHLSNTDISQCLLADALELCLLRNTWRRKQKTDRPGLMMLTPHLPWPSWDNWKVVHSVSWNIQNVPDWNTAYRAEMIAFSTEQKILYFLHSNCTVYLNIL